MSELTEQILSLNYTFKTKSKFETFTVIVAFFSCMVIVVLVIKMLWNSVVPRVFGVKEIDFMDTIILLILSNIFIRK